MKLPLIYKIIELLHKTIHNILISHRKEDTTFPHNSTHLYEDIINDKVNKVNRYPDIFGGFALQTVLENYNFQTVLDIGSGSGTHAEIFENAEKKVTTIDYGVSVYYKQKKSNHVDIKADYNTYKFDKQFDLVWASHILEHQTNPGLFLKKIHSDLKEGGMLVVVVPPLKNQIGGGHVTLWNAGILLYQLILARFNCRHASILKYGYNISIIVKKKTINQLPHLHYDSGDIDRLSNYFPEPYNREGFDGDILVWNWPGFD